MPHAWPLKKRRIVSHAPLHAAPLPSASSTATATSVRPMRREKSGSSRPPIRRSGACGAMRRASQTLTRTGTSIAANPMPNSAICAHSRVWSTSRRPSASYHMTSVMRLTAPPSRPSTMMSATIPPPMRTHRRHGRSLPKTGRATGGPPPCPFPFPPRRREALRPSSIGVTLRSMAGPRVARPPRPGGAGAPRAACRTSLTSGHLVGLEDLSAHGDRLHVGEGRHRPA